MNEPDRTFWHDRWAQGQIGFHEGKPNDLLVAHVDRLEAAGAKLRILVPLAGKASDVWWLAQRGHDVVGVELVPQAVEAFFREKGLEDRKERRALGRHEAFTANGVTMVVADFFALDPAVVGPFDAVYDRAALIALDPDARERYVAQCRALSKPGARTLLVSAAYDQSKAEGPPWSVDEPTVRKLYAGRSIDVLQAREVPPNPRLRDAGIASLVETAYLIL
jgi:thiopurine S-methyltransferase